MISFDSFLDFLQQLFDLVGTIFVAVECELDSDRSRGCSRVLDEREKVGEFFGRRNEDLVVIFVRVGE